MPERLRRRRRAVRVAGGQEPDVDDPGARDADVGIHRGAEEDGEALMREPSTTRRSCRHHLPPLPWRPASSGPRPRRSRPIIRHRLPQASRPEDRDAVPAEVLHASRIRDGDDAGRHHHSEGRTLRQRHRGRRAAVHGLHDDRSAGTSDRDARRPGLAGSRVRQPVRERLPDLHAAAARRRCSTTSAWPHKARPEHAHGVAFFNSFRDLTASGFFTSKMGLEDLQYMGNRYVPEWTGCPPEVLKKLGLGGDTA